MNSLNLGSNNVPSVIMDPFDHGNIRAITVYVRDLFGKGEFKYSARIEFNNGNTSGEQRIEGDSFEDVVSQIRQLVDSLSNKQ